MKILVTGYRGFIGKSVVKALVRKKIEFVPFDGDVLIPEDFNRQKYSNCDALLHFAGIVKPVSEKQVDNMYRVNINGTLNALLAAHKGRMCFFLASSYVYDKHAEQPVKENAKTGFFDDYSCSKINAENLVLSFSQIHNLKGAILRIFNVYGPGQPGGFLMTDIAKNIQSGKVVLKEGKSIRDYIFIDDLADLVCEVVMNPPKFMEILNCGSGIGLSVKQIVDVFVSVLQPNISIKYGDHQPAIPEAVADMAKVKSQYNWVPNTDIRKGICEILKAEKIDYFL